MTWGLVAIGGATVVGAGLGYVASQNAAETQAEAATNATQSANETQLKMFEEGRADTAPWREAGKNALAELVKKVEAGPGAYRRSPGYEFRLGEGTKALERSAAASGKLFSGDTGKALVRYGQDYATGDYQNFLANYYNSLTPLQSIAQVGQTTASQNAVTGSQVGSGIASNTMIGGVTAGQAQAAGSINQANAITGGLNSGINNYLMWKYLNQTPGVTPSGTYSTGASMLPNKPYFTPDNTLASIE